MPGGIRGKISLRIEPVGLSSRMCRDSSVGLFAVLMCRLLARRSLKLSKFHVAVGA